MKNIIDEIKSFEIDLLLKYNNSKSCETDIIMINI